MENSKVNTFKKPFPYHDIHVYMPTPRSGSSQGPNPPSFLSACSSTLVHESSLVYIVLWETTCTATSVRPGYVGAAVTLIQFSMPGTGRLLQKTLVDPEVKCFWLFSLEVKSTRDR